MQEIKKVINRLYGLGLKIQICWIPAHVGIPGNEKADEAAKSAVNSPLFSAKLPVKDYICMLKQIIQTAWQNEWDNESNNNKLKQIKPFISSWASSNQSDRKAEVLLTRLRIGHSRLTHDYLMSTPHGDVPRCRCNSTLTIKHLLIECRLFNQQRYIYFKNKSMAEILGESEQFSVSRVLQFLKSTGFINQI